MAPVVFIVTYFYILLQYHTIATIQVAMLRVAFRLMIETKNVFLYNRLSLADKSSKVIISSMFGELVRTGKRVEKLMSSATCEHTFIQHYVT